MGDEVHHPMGEDHQAEDNAYMRPMPGSAPQPPSQQSEKHRPDHSHEQAVLPVRRMDGGAWLGPCLEPYRGKSEPQNIEHIVAEYQVSDIDFRSDPLGSETDSKMRDSRHKKTPFLPGAIEFQIREPSAFSSLPLSRSPRALDADHRDLGEALFEDRRLEFF